MAEWLTLLLLIPAIIVPVILLTGFAACDRVFGLSSGPVTAPTIDSATPKDAVTITLVWEGGSGDHYQFERTNPDDTITNFNAPFPAKPLDDTGLLPASTYKYRVRVIDNSGDPADWSNSVSATTLPVTSAYQKALTEDSANWQGFTLVQRIEAAQLGATGPHVRITVQASSVSDASVNRLYISQAASTGQPYDSAPDLTQVYDFAANQQQPFVVPAGTTKQLPIVAYTINRFQALLVAIDFSATPVSGIETTAAVPASEASAYFLQTAGGEAAVQVRSANYQPSPRVYFITNIEVG